MPVCSYIVYPDPGKTQELHARLEALRGCSVFPAERHDLLLLVTDTPDDIEEKRLNEELKALPYVQCLAMSFAHGEEEAS